MTLMMVMMIAGVDDANGGDGVQQSQVSSSEPGPSILASNVIGPLLLEVSHCYYCYIITLYTLCARMTPNIKWLLTPAENFFWSPQGQTTVSIGVKFDRGPKDRSMFWDFWLEKNTKSANFCDFFAPQG